MGDAALQHSPTTPGYDCSKVLRRRASKIPRSVGARKITIAVKQPAYEGRTRPAQSIPHDCPALHRGHGVFEGS